MNVILFVSRSFPRIQRPARISRPLHSLERVTREKNCCLPSELSVSNHRSNRHPTTLLSISHSLLTCYISGVYTSHGGVMNAASLKASYFRRRWIRILRIDRTMQFNQLSSVFVPSKIVV